MGTSNVTTARSDVKAPRGANLEDKASFSLESPANPILFVMTINREVYLAESRSFRSLVRLTDTVPPDPSGISEGYLRREPSHRALGVGTVVPIGGGRRPPIFKMSSDYRNNLAMMEIGNRQTSSPEPLTEEERITSRGTNTGLEWFSAAVFSLGGTALFGILMMLFALYALDKWIETKWIVDTVAIIGAAIVSISGIVWIVIAWLMIAITARKWWKGRS